MIEKIEFINWPIKNFFKKFILPLSLVLIVYLSTFSHDKKISETFPVFFEKKNHDFKINESPLAENNQSYCEKSQEWSDINAELFIRRQTANYFIDRKTLLVFTMCKGSWMQKFRFAFNVSILHNNNLISNRKHDEVKSDRFVSINGYEDYSMGVALDLEEFISDYNTNNPTIAEIKIFDLKIE